MQIILNAFRLKPLERVLPAAAAAGVGIIARVPLASGLLSGRYDEHTTFAADDHRNYNRHGEAFDVGETFSGVDFGTGLEAVRRLRAAGAAGRDDGAVRAALDRSTSPASRWSSRAPATRSRRGPTPRPTRWRPCRRRPRDAVRDVYDELIRPQIHDRW